MKRDIPRATVSRLPLYLQCLEALPDHQTTVSSEELAERAGVTSAKVRKDLSHLGSHGVRGVGYDIAHLGFQIRLELGLTQDWPVVIVGVGNLGAALANYGGFGEHGFTVVGIYDADPAKIGSVVAGRQVRNIENLESDVRDAEVAIGIVTTPGHVAQAVAERLAAAGVHSILNFAPAVLQLDEDVEVRNVDLSTELQILAFYLQRRSERV